jgi:hypothetical protein
MSDSLQHHCEPEKELEVAVSNDDVTPPKEEYPSTFGLSFMIIALVLAMSLASLDFTIVGTAIPKITEEFQALDSVQIPEHHQLVHY